MMYKTLLLQKAKKDILEAKKWYENQKVGLGKLFALEVKIKLSQIAKMPTAYTIKHKNVRYAKTKKFPYYIYFSINEETNSVSILSMLHNRRQEKI